MCVCVWRSILNLTSNYEIKPLFSYTYSYLPTPPLGRDMTQGQFLSGVLTGLNSEFSFSLTSCFTKAEETSLSYYFSQSWRENNWINTFPKGIN